jgi:hypothetical protein
VDETGISGSGILRRIDHKRKHENKKNKIKGNIFKRELGFTLY